jgi:putative SOS response-associated peptidase YedK
MCGYARRHISNRDLNKFMEFVKLMDIHHSSPPGEELQHFYPAFGGAASRQIKSMIIQEDGKLKSVDATWWFDCQEVDGDLIVNNKRTTFNARNLTSPYWKGAIRHNRGIAIVTAIGEGKVIGKKNHQYFVEGEEPLLLGTVYRRFPNGHYSTAVITRDAHARFEDYHDKAFPLMLPPDPEFLALWLGEEPETHPAIAHLLENPRIFTGLKITPVKTFKDAVPVGETIHLEPDDIAA